MADIYVKGLAIQMGWRDTLPQVETHGQHDGC
jgi:hypothetical protein